MRLSGTKVLVVGMKKSGMASAEFLVKQGARVCATDLNLDCQGYSCSSGLTAA